MEKKISCPRCGSQYTKVIKSIFGEYYNVECLERKRLGSMDGKGVSRCRFKKWIDLTVKK